MKKELIISSIITIILIAGVIVWNRQPKTTSSTTTPATPSSTEFQTSRTASVTKKEVATHNAANDCWIIIDANAYNVTDYLALHPAGGEIILPTCGSDATTAYDVIKGGKGHSVQAATELSALLVGAIQ